MRITAHLDKYNRLNSLRQRLDPLDDFELWFWTGLTAGTNLINAALHRVGITMENDLFATQVPDIYAVPEENGRWHLEIASLCDLIHVGLPQLNCPVPAPIDDAIRAMEFIERYRDPCVRGTHPVTAELAREIDAAYTQCIAAATEILQDARGGQA